MVIHCARLGPGVFEPKIPGDARRPPFTSESFSPSRYSSTEIKGSVFKSVAIPLRSSSKMSRSKPPRPGTPVVRKQAGRLFYRSTRVPLVFPAPNLRQRPREGWTGGAGHLAASAAGCVEGGDAEALAPADLRQPEPSGLASRGARECRRAGAWRRTLRAKSVRTNAAEEGPGSTRIVVGRRRIHS